MVDELFPVFLSAQFFQQKRPFAEIRLCQFLQQFPYPKK